MHTYSRRFIRDIFKLVISTYHEEDNALNAELVYKYGYDKDGVNAKVFLFEDKIVLAIKGTSLYIFGLNLGNSSMNDKLLDEVLFTKCENTGKISLYSYNDTFKKYDIEECEYNKKIIFDQLGYFKDLELLLNILKRVYPNKKIIITGHSLGGTLASLLAMKYGHVSFIFSSPGDHYISRVLGIYKRKRFKNIVHIGLCEDIIFRGTCNGTDLCSIAGYTINTQCHVGRVLCIKSGMKKSVLIHHSYFLLEYLKKKYQLEILKEDCLI